MVGAKTDLMLYTATNSVTGTGATSKLWTPVRKLTGVMSTLSQAEEVKFNRNIVTARMKFRIDYPSGTIPKQGDELRDGATVYNVTAIENPSILNRYINVFVLERT